MTNRYLRALHPTFGRYLFYSITELQLFCWKNIFFFILYLVKMVNWLYTSRDLGHILAPSKVNTYLQNV